VAINFRRTPARSPLALNASPNPPFSTRNLPGHVWTASKLIKDDHRSWPIRRTSPDQLRHQPQRRFPGALVDFPKIVTSFPLVPLRRGKGRPSEKLAGLSAPRTQASPAPRANTTPQLITDKTAFRLHNGGNREANGQGDSASNLRVQPVVVQHRCSRPGR